VGGGGKILPATNRKPRLSQRGGGEMEREKERDSKKRKGSVEEQQPVSIQKGGQGGQWIHVEHSSVRPQSQKGEV